MYCCRVAFLSFITFPFLAFANDTESEPQNEMQRWWLEAHQSGSERVISWSNGIDSFLSGDDNSKSAALESEVEIRFGSIFEKSETGFFDLKARLDLPHTEEKLQLLIDSDADSLTPETVRKESTEESNVIDSVLESTLSAAIRYVESDLGADVRVGVLADWPLDPFVRLRFQQGDKNDSWRWKQTQELFSYYTLGEGAKYQLGFQHLVTPSIRYGSDFSIVWLDEDKLYYARENIFLHHRLSSLSSLSYQLSFLQSGDEKLLLDTVLYNLTYERLLYKDWFVAQIKPQFTHEQDEDFEAEFSLTLSLSIFLGSKYLN